MTLALIILVCFGVNTAGGFSAVAENAQSLKGYFSLISSHDPTTGEASKYSFLSIVSTLAWGLGYFGMPHILLRFMAISDGGKIKTSRRIASVWVVISMAIAIFIGFIGNAMSASGKIDTLVGSSQSEKVVIKIAELMSENGVVAALFAGLIFAGILACTMSTSDSQLLAASSSMSENIIGGVFKIKLSQKMSMITARIVLVVIALISVIIAWNPDSSVFEIVSFAWAGFGATFGPVMLAALFWKRSNKYGAIAGMAAGGIMVFAWKFGISKLGGAFAIYELLPAFITAVIAIVIVSLATAKPDKEITDEFDAVCAELK
jgi:sodium/proline symporter